MTAPATVGAPWQNPTFHPVSVLRRRRDLPVFLLANALICVPSGLFARSVCPWLVHHLSAAPVVLFAVLWALTLVCLWITSAMDAGVVPPYVPPLTETAVDPGDSGAAAAAAAGHHRSRSLTADTTPAAADGAASTPPGSSRTPSMHPMLPMPHAGASAASTALAVKAGLLPASAASPPSPASPSAVPSPVSSRAYDGHASEDGEEDQRSRSGLAGITYTSSRTPPPMVTTTTTTTTTTMAAPAGERYPPLPASYPFMANPLPTGTTTLTNAAGASIELKYCGTCHLWRPPRSTHCRVCNRCVLLQDHHCAWTANCIGERNWPMFMAFLWSASLLGAWILAFGVAQLVVEARDRRWSAAAIIGFYPATMAALVMVAVFAPSVFCLATFTIYLSSHNRTTRENMRRRLGRRRGAPPPPHPYDLGSGWRNLLAALTRSPARYGAFVGQPIPRPGPIVV